MIGLGMNSFINSQGFGGNRNDDGVVLRCVYPILFYQSVFIFLFYMGVKGAALATVISQGLSALWILRFLTSPKIFLRLKAICFRLKASRVKDIVALGMTGFTM